MTEGPHGEIDAYRPCVAMLLFNADGRVLVAERNDLEDTAWQLPQGGVDPGESVEAAARREMIEEIGVGAVEFLGEAAEWHRYDLPRALEQNRWRGIYRGQRVKLTAFRFSGTDDEINLETEAPEFRAWRWVELEDLPRLIVSFKKPLYEQAVSEFRAVRDALRQRNRP